VLIKNKLHFFPYFISETQFSIDLGLTELHIIDAEYDGIIGGHMLFSLEKQAKSFIDFIVNYTKSGICISLFKTLLLANFQIFSVSACNVHIHS